MVNCTCADAVKIVKLEAQCPEFQLSSIEKTDNPIFRFFASHYIPGQHKIKISVDYIDSEGLDRSYQCWTSVKFPDAWAVEAQVFTISESTTLTSFTVKPTVCDNNLKIASISIDDQPAQEFNHEVTAGAVVYYTAILDSASNHLCIKLMEHVDGIFNFRIPVTIQQRNTVYSSCKPVETNTKYTLQKAIEFSASVSIPLSSPFELEFDPECWMIEEPQLGHFEGTNLRFSAVPVKAGSLLIPNLRSIDDSIKIHNLSRGSTINCIEE